MPFTRTDFDVLAQGQDAWLSTHYFQPHINLIVDHLNTRSPIACLQQCRRIILNKRYGGETFLPYEAVMALGWTRFNRYQYHWYHFNQGGLSEYQFNLGMAGGPAGYFRVGTGFNLDGGIDGERVFSYLRAFQGTVAANRVAFERLIQELNLRVEAYPDASDPRQITIEFCISNQDTFTVAMATWNSG